MKKRFNRFLGTFAVIAMTQAAHGTSDTWDGSQNTGTWSDAANWSTTPAIVPGTGDTATFSTAGGTVDVISLGGAPGVTIDNLLFDTATPGIISNVITWPMGATYSGSFGTDYVVQTSPDLVTWTSATVGVGAGFVAITPGTSVTYTLAPPVGKLFVRLKVTGP